LQTNRTCSTPDIGGAGGAIGMAVALDIASPASAAADKRIAIGFPIKASLRGYERASRKIVAEEPNGTAAEIAKAALRLFE
jgi:hypothetical protein